MKIIIISTQSGDWEAIYIDGELVEEGHQIDRIRLLELSEEFAFNAEDIQNAELDDEDEDVVASYGSMEGRINTLKYIK